MSRRQTIPEGAPIGLPYNNEPDLKEKGSEKFAGVLFVSDMDGTLLNSSHEVSRENAEAIGYFTGAGGLFTVATGRMPGAVIPFTRQITINAPIISYNGALI